MQQELRVFTSHAFSIMETRVKSLYVICVLHNATRVKSLHVTHVLNNATRVKSLHVTCVLNNAIRVKSRHATYVLNNAITFKSRHVTCVLKPCQSSYTPITTYRISTPHSLRNKWAHSIIGTTDNTVRYCIYAAVLLVPLSTVLTYVTINSFKWLIFILRNQGVFVV
jgi:hypothetical protein